MEAILRYFPELDQSRKGQFQALGALYASWNEQINVISRKDIEHLYVRHVLHSLAIYRFLPFQPGSVVLDIGTGGGFPGIPLAIMQPEVEFVLCDSIGKKIKVVRAVAEALDLKNVEAVHGRAEAVRKKVDFAVSRAVAPLPDLIGWCRPNVHSNQRNALPNGLICLKGGDLREELKLAGRKAEVHDLSGYFKEDFFEEKKLVYVAF